MVVNSSVQMVLYLGAAVVAGGLIGLERSYHGRAAGFRTYALVCLSSSMLMLVSLFPPPWLAGMAPEARFLDSTRMAQGIMTGIGFLGAGVILKEGFQVRGLTTAASIWVTAAIGILIGLGSHATALAATVLTLGILAVFRWIEDRIPAQVFARGSVRFARAATMPETTFRALLDAHGFAIDEISYRLTEGGAGFEYRIVLYTRNVDNLRRLAETLTADGSVKEFQISPSRD